MGTRLQRLRHAANMSQRELSAAAAVPLGTLRNYEQDRRTPNLDVAIQLARALGVSLDELAGLRPSPDASTSQKRPPESLP